MAARYRTMAGKANATASRRRKKYRRRMMTRTEGNSPPHSLSVIMPQVAVDWGEVTENYFCPKAGTAPEWEPLPHRFNSAEKSGVDPALPDGIGYTVDGQHVSRNAVINMMGLGITDHVLER